MGNPQLRWVLRVGYVQAYLVTPPHVVGFLYGDATCMETLFVWRHKKAPAFAEALVRDGECLHVQVLAGAG